MSRHKKNNDLIVTINQPPTLKTDIEIKVPQHEILIGSQTWYNQTVSFCFKAGSYVEIISKKNNGYIVKLNVNKMALSVELPEWAIDNGN